MSKWAEMKKAKEGKTTKATNNARVGLNKGYQTTKRPKKLNAGKRLKVPKTKLNAVREIISEVAGFSPYEKRIIELLRVQREKRALRFAKRRLGTFLRAKKKRELVSNIMRKQPAKRK
eukprot:TRINITY_DN25152_c0_g1_i2.p3 TRINITY_DN25152_c0_g1~~TRINITY_DN25152_c0_g1_i2.p3  ORF type:complete len:118 (+),score=46.79 TRINITY_DN25152_c0_g1_i2:78-431(+)